MSIGYKEGEAHHMSSVEIGANQQNALTLSPFPMLQPLHRVIQKVREEDRWQKQCQRLQTKWWWS
jgi:hypothetical protein